MTRKQLSWIRLSILAASVIQAATPNSRVNWRSISSESSSTIFTTVLQLQSFASGQPHLRRIFCYLPTQSAPFYSHTATYYYVHSFTQLPNFLSLLSILPSHQPFQIHHRNTSSSLSPVDYNNKASTRAYSILGRVQACIPQANSNLLRKRS